MGLKIKIEFHLHVYRDGKLLKTQTETDDKTDARLLATTALDAIEELAPSHSQSTIANYMTAVRSFLQFAGREVRIEQIDIQMLKNYEHWLRQNGLNLNTISCYMRSLRSLLVKLGRGDALNCFHEVYTGRAQTPKRSITEEDIVRIKSVKLRKNCFLYLVRDLFMFSFYAMGMPFVDMAYLKRSQIKDGQFSYHRHKTGQTVNVLIEPCMQEIIDHYTDCKGAYVFPLLSSELPPLAYVQYLRKLNSYNKALKRLAAAAGIKGTLTSYVPRHSWASIAYQSNVALSLISQALGHANPHNTMTYIRQIDGEQLKSANRNLINNLELL